ncbi:hypothetical protein ACFX1T_039280 [Malus domestica]
MLDKMASWTRETLSSETAFKLTRLVYGNEALVQIVDSSFQFCLLGHPKSRFPVLPALLGYPKSRFSVLPARTPEV